jgi:hypothetical protein
MIIWDYDTAIGQVNASYPYNFHEELLVQEIENVDRILASAASHALRMTFACVGFAAESGQYPYHVPDQLRRIHAASHEVASHSWRHEWFPFLEREQVARSLKRSKEALERCLGEAGAVQGFVPPFSRPMTWYRKGAISLGDRTLNPLRAGGNIGALCEEVRNAGYAWCRVSYRALTERLTGRRGAAPITGRIGRSSGVACVPHHYTGFDQGALDLLDKAVRRNCSIVIVGHPSGLTRDGAENHAHLERFLDKVAALRDAGRIQARTVMEHLATEGAAS